MSKILLKNATIYPITSNVLTECDILVDTSILLIGKNIPHSIDTTIINCTGKYVFPGFIDVHTHMGLYDEGTGWAGNDANETSHIASPHIRSIDGINPLDIAFKDAIHAGITTVHVMPGSGNVIGGTTCVIKTSGDTISKMIIKEPAGLKIAFGENPKKIHSFGNKNSMTRMGIMGVLRETFHHAIHSQDTNLQTLSIIKALNKEIPVRAHAHRSDDIYSAIRLADEFDLDLRIEHCTEGHLIVDSLASRNLQVSIGPTLTRRSKVELKNKTWSTYTTLTNHGINVSITTDHPYTPIQYLNICAAIAMREGLSEQKALEGITILPAKNLGIQNIVGSLEVGKDADIVVWSHHPFHFISKPLLTMINGNIQFNHII